MEERRENKKAEKANDEKFVKIILTQDEEYKNAQKEKAKNLKVKEKELAKFRLAQMGAGQYDSAQVQSAENGGNRNQFHSANSPSVASGA